jgi:hypothetical protein
MDKTREDPRESPTRELSRNPTRWTFGTAWGLIIIMIIIISSNRRRETRRDVIIQEKSIGSGCFIITIVYSISVRQSRSIPNIQYGLGTRSTMIHVESGTFSTTMTNAHGLPKISESHCPGVPYDTLSSLCRWACTCVYGTRVVHDMIHPCLGTYQSISHSVRHGRVHTSLSRSSSSHVQDYLPARAY